MPGVLEIVLDWKMECGILRSEHLAGPVLLYLVQQVEAAFALNSEVSFEAHSLQNV
jgi:hypothetical protein